MRFVLQQTTPSGNVSMKLDVPCPEKLMKLGILSDTHNQLNRTRRAVELLREAGAEVLVHCGDITRGEIVAACSLLPCHYVLGNNDGENVTELKSAIQETGGTCLMWSGELELAGRRIGIAHGHYHTDVRKLLAGEPDYLLSGHSHMAHDERVGSVRRINPGALHRAPSFSVAVLDLVTDELKFLPVAR
jgi:uncharacterized protein